MNFVLKEGETTSSHGDYASVEDEETLHEDMLEEITTIGMPSEILMPKEGSVDEDEMDLLEDWLHKIQVMRIQVQFKIILLNSMKS